jgi:hypothetical protein
MVLISDPDVRSVPVEYKIHWEKSYSIIRKLEKMALSKDNLPM